MGNDQTKNEKSDSGKTRVVIVSPSASENWDKAKTRIKFLGVKRNHVTYTKRPQMIDVGKLTQDVIYGRRAKFQRSQARAVGIAEPGENNMASLTSVDTVTSAPGVPTIATYREPDDDSEWEERPVKHQALTKVDEI